MAEELPIKYVKQNGEKFLPVTSPKAVIDENGKSINELFEFYDNVIPSRLPSIDERNFLENEYEKTLNLIGIAQNSSVSANGVTYYVNDGIVYKSGTSTSAFGVMLQLQQPFTLKAGKTYSFINLGNTQNQETSLKNASGNNIITISYRSSKTLYTATSDTTITQLGYWIQSGVPTKNDYFMLIEGDVNPTEFYQYNGEIVHKKDITPVNVTNSIIFTKTDGTGTLVVQDAYRVGNIINMTVICSCTTNASAGSDFWKGKLNFTHKNSVRAIAFAQTKFVVFYLDKDGTSGVRALADVTSGQNFTLGVTIMV